MWGKSRWISRIKNSYEGEIRVRCLSQWDDHRVLAWKALSFFFLIKRGIWVFTIRDWCWRHGKCQKETNGDDSALLFTPPGVTDQQTWNTLGCHTRTRETAPALSNISIHLQTYLIPERTFWFEWEALCWATSKDFSVGTFSRLWIMLVAVLWFESVCCSRTRMVCHTWCSYDWQAHSAMREWSWCLSVNWIWAASGSCSRTHTKRDAPIPELKLSWLKSL